MDINSLIGKVQSVDTGNISVRVEKEELLNSVQVNQIIQIRSTKDRRIYNFTFSQN